VNVKHQFNKHGNHSSNDHTYIVILGGPRGEQFEINFHSDENNSDCQLFVSSIDQNGNKSNPEKVSMSDFSWDPSIPLIKVGFESEQLTVQYIGKTIEGYELQFAGSLSEVIVRTPKEQSFAKFMLPPEERDTSKLLLCPMPGQIVNFSVQEGQEVEIGQEVAVIEAMKMRNILRAPKKGIVKKIKCKIGESLKVDSTIMEFE
jgi:acetyl/propionyl-CoA carboxylase alpha subunit